MTRFRFFSRAALAGTLLMSVVGVEGAGAMTVAPAVSAGGGGLTTVQYLRYPDYRYRRFNRYRRAGLYRCGPGGTHTHLERKACR